MENDERRRFLLLAIHKATHGRVKERVKIERIDLSAAPGGDPYPSEEDLQSDLLFLEERGLIIATKTAGGIIAVCLNSYGVEEAERTVAPLARVPADIEGKLSHLFDNRMELIGGDITSNAGRKWLADISALIGFVDSKAKERFDDLAHKIMIPFTNQTRVPIWNSLQLTIESVISGLKTIGGLSPERVYPAGHVYDFYRDLRKQISSASISVFIVDPYVDDDLFDAYLGEVPSSITARLLTKKPKPQAQRAIELFTRQAGGTFECRLSGDIHDRVVIIDASVCLVLGQSIKDAASTKPTYMTQIFSEDMITLYESLWCSARAFTPNDAAEP